MGTFKVALQIGNHDDQWEWAEARVDTGATYSMLPGSLLRSLGLTPIRQIQFVLADGRRIDYEMAQAEALRR